MWSIFVGTWIPRVVPYWRRPPIFPSYSHHVRWGVVGQCWSTNPHDLCLSSDNWQWEHVTELDISRLSRWTGGWRRVWIICGATRNPPRSIKIRYHPIESLMGSSGGAELLNCRISISPSARLGQTTNNKNMCNVQHPLPISIVLIKIQFLVRMNQQIYRYNLQFCPVYHFWQTATPSVYKSVLAPFSAPGWCSSRQCARSCTTSASKLKGQGQWKTRWVMGLAIPA